MNIRTIALIVSAVSFVFTIICLMRTVKYTREAKRSLQRVVEIRERMKDGDL